MGGGLGLGDNIVAIAAVSETDNTVDGALEELYFLQFAEPACLLDRGQLNSHIVILLVDFQVDDRAGVHLILEVVLGHEAGDEIPEILLLDSNFVGDVGDHQPAHLFGVGKGAVGDGRKEVHAGDP